MHTYKEYHFEILLRVDDKQIFKVDTFKLSEDEKKRNDNYNESLAVYKINRVKRNFKDMLSTNSKLIIRETQYITIYKDDIEL